MNQELVNICGISMLKLQNSNVATLIPGDLISENEHNKAIEAFMQRKSKSNFIN